MQARNRQGLYSARSVLATVWSASQTLTDSLQDSTGRETSEKDHLAEDNLKHRKMTSLAHGRQVISGICVCGRDMGFEPRPLASTVNI